MDKKTIANIIVDLYEMRVSTIHKYQSKDEKIQDCYKYSFFTCAIARLCDKYKVEKDDIDEILRERSFNNLTPNSPE